MTTPLVTLPPLGDPPPVDPPDPAVDPHAYNVWAARWANWHWLAAAYQQRECVESRIELSAVFGNGLADILDQYDRQHRRAMFLEFARGFVVRPGDTDASLPKTIKAQFDNLLNILEPPSAP